jgi:hypothetical protein
MNNTVQKIMTQALAGIGYKSQDYGEKYPEIHVTATTQGVRIVDACFSASIPMTTPTMASTGIARRMNEAAARSVRTPT